MWTFEDKEDYIENIQQQQLMQGMMWGGQPLPQPAQMPTEAAGITEQVAGWGLVAWMGV
jgi:hypothetical protein